MEKNNNWASVVKNEEKSFTAVEWPTLDDKKPKVEFVDQEMR